jgi:hypothetical protein
MYTTQYYTIGNLDKYHEVIKDICDYFGVTWYDLRACGINWQNKGYTLGDGIHPKAAGMDLMYKYIRTRLLATYALDEGENVVYTVTNSLTNVTSNGSYIKGVTSGKGYTATLTAASGYTISSVTVTMGGTDITSTAYSNGTISISSVMGNVVITAIASSAPLSSFTITNTLTNVTNSNNASTITENDSYSATLTADTGYTLDSVTVTMGGVDITSTAYSSGTVTIASVTGNIVITASATSDTPTETWYHSAQSMSSGAAVNLAGRGWCYRDNINDDLIGVPINAIKFWTNSAISNGDVSISVVDKNTSEPISTTTATYTKTGSTIEEITVVFPDTLTLQSGQYLSFFSQASTNFQFVFASVGSGVGFYSRVPKVYGSGTAWTESTNGDIRISVGYVPSE